MFVPAWKLAALALVGGATAVSLAACNDTGRSSDATEPTHQATATTPATGLPGDENLGDDTDDLDGDVYEGPQTPSAESQQAAKDKAVDALEAYYDTDQPADEWFDQLRPHLSSPSQDAYETVDPARIAPLELEGSPSVVRFDGGGGITIAVPTNDGDVQVDLVIESAGHDWLVDRFHFPHGDG